MEPRPTDSRRLSEIIRPVLQNLKLRKITRERRLKLELASREATSKTNRRAAAGWQTNHEQNSVESLSTQHKRALPKCRTEQIEECTAQVGCGMDRPFFSVIHTTWWTVLTLDTTISAGLAMIPDPLRTPRSHYNQLSCEGCFLLRRRPEVSRKGSPLQC